METLLALVVLLAGVPYLVPLPERTPLPGNSPYANGFFQEACGVRWHGQLWRPAAEPSGVVVLFHGFSGSTFSWRQVGPALAEANLLALALDLPPFGFSSRRPPQGDFLPCLAEVVRQVAAQGPYVMVGHSMGAGVAYALAHRWQGEVAGVVLVDGAPALGSRRGGGVRQVLLVGPGGRWAEVVAHRFLLRPWRFSQTLASAYGREPTPAEVEGYRRPLTVAGTAAAVFRQLPWRLPPIGRPSSLPTLIVWGSEDRWVPPSVAEKAQARLGGELRWVAGAGHCPMETHTDAFLQVLIPFLQSALSPKGHTGIPGPEASSAAEGSGLSPLRDGHPRQR